MSALKFSAWLGAVMLLIASAAAQAAAPMPTRMTVVYKGGKSVTSMLPVSSYGEVIKTTGVCAGDDAALFAFTEEPTSPTVSRETATTEFGVRVRVACSNFLGSISLEYSNNANTLPPVAGVSVSAREHAQLSISPGAGGQEAVVNFQVSITAPAYPEEVSFFVSRIGGSFNGEAVFGDEEVPVIGEIQGSSNLFSIKVLKGEVPEVDEEIINEISDINEDPNLGAILDDTRGHCSADNLNDPACQALATLVEAVNNGEEGAADDLKEVLRAISPEKATAVASTGAQLAAGQVGNVALRVAQLMHGTGGGFSTSGLAVMGGGMPLSLDMIGDVLNAAGNGDNEEKRTLLGGTKWGIWLNGTIGGGKHDRYRGNSGFDYDNWSLTSGVDYRFTDSLFFGVAAGFSRFSSDFHEVKDWLDANSYAMHLYGGYSHPKGLSLDGSLSWMLTDYELFRYLPSPGSANLTALDYRTKGAPTARQVSAAFGASWYFQGDSWTLAPTIQYQYLDSSIDAFEENGASIFRLRYESQSVWTGSLSAGMYGDRSFATGAGTFRPYARALWYNDSGTGARNVMAEFVEGGATINSVVLAEPDRSYGTLELGLGFRRPIGTRTVDFNLGAMKVFEFEALDRWSVRADMRVPF